MDVLKLEKYVVAADMSADITGDTISTSHMGVVGYVAVATGTPTSGSLEIQGSVDGTTWVVLSSVAVAAAGTFFDTVPDYAYPFARVVYDFATGTGALTVQLSAKGFI